MSNEAAKILFWKEMEAQLPAGALSCEYIEATSTNQKVDTGIHISDKLQIVLRGSMVFPSSYSQETWLFGAWDHSYGEPHNLRSYLIGCYQNTLRSEAGPDVAQYWGMINRDNGVHDYAMMEDGCYIDGQRKADSAFDYLPFNNTASLTLVNSNHANQGSVTKRVHAFQAIDLSGKLVMNLMAAYSQDYGQAGFWDSVGKRWLFGINGLAMGYKLA